MICRFIIFIHNTALAIREQVIKLDYFISAPIVMLVLLQSVPCSKVMIDFVKQRDTSPYAKVFAVNFLAYFVGITSFSVCLIAQYTCDQVSFKNKEVEKLRT